MAEKDTSWHIYEHHHGKNYTAVRELSGVELVLYAIFVLPFKICYWVFWLAFKMIGGLFMIIAAIYEAFSGSDETKSDKK